MHKKYVRANERVLLQVSSGTRAVVYETARSGEIGDQTPSGIINDGPRISGPEHDRNIVRRHAVVLTFQDYTMTK